MYQTFSENNFHTLCDNLSSMDSDLSAVIRDHGYPPMWTRPNSFETLVHVILEQQVSLASAMAALKMLKEKIVTIEPQNVLTLNDEEMRACFISRQKMGYLRGLANAVQSGELDLAKLESMEDEQVRGALTKLKGIGNWTADVYLMFVLRHTDIFPFGDIAVINSIRKVKGLPKDFPKEEMTGITDSWKPYRSIAAYILWHDYLSRSPKKSTEASPV